jgi:hypothetical protein
VVWFLDCGLTIRISFALCQNQKGFAFTQKGYPVNPVHGV